MERNEKCIDQLDEQDLRVGRSGTGIQDGADRAMFYPDPDAAFYSVVIFRLFAKDILARSRVNPSLFNKVWLLNELERTIASMNWKQAAEDVRLFVRVEEQPSLDL